MGSGKRKWDDECQTRGRAPGTEQTFDHSSLRYYVFMTFLGIVWIHNDCVEKKSIVMAWRREARRVGERERGAC